MVNNREVLKNNLEADLHKKIQLAEEALTELREAVQKVEDTSATAKGNVNQTVESIQQLIAIRKLALTRQIDIMCHSQVNALQEEIRATYIALGSLQSTLFNLDSFDHNQLLNLHIPELSWKKGTSLPAPIQLNVDDTAVKQQLNTWGSVNANGLKGIFDIGSSASLPKRFVEYNDGKNDQEFMCHKSVCSEPTSIFNFTRQPKLPSTSKTSTTLKMAQAPFSVEQWLSGIKSQTCPDNEDFEIVSIESASEETCTKDKKEVVTAKESESMEDDGDSSIVCLKNENPSSTDLSKWLKPKKNSECPNSNKPSISELENKYLNTEQKCASAYSHNPSKNRFVDFPCLRQDFKTWKKNRANNIISDLPFSLSQKKDLFPPELALPNAFWLKKYR